MFEVKLREFCVEYQRDGGEMLRSYFFATTDTLLDEFRASPDVVRVYEIDNRGYEIRCTVVPVMVKLDRYETRN